MDADYKFAESELDEAHELYMEALKVDEKNEYALANIGLIYLKRSNY
jgi:Flp pilus assembly protein TadD